MDAGLLAGRVNLLGPWLRSSFGARVVKIGLDAGLGCPHRPGRVGAGGCSFCPPNASGRGGDRQAVEAQLAQGLARIKKNSLSSKALAYFQAFSSTFADAATLRRLYGAALDTPGVAGLIVSTRPDCLDAERWQVLAECAKRAPFWLELGLQSAHDSTLKAIKRGHDLACFDRAMEQAHGYGIKVAVHVILGLPGEDISHTGATARHLAGLSVWGVKVHNIMVLEGSALAHDWRAGRFAPWGLEQWVEAAADFLTRLPQETLIHRLAADPGRDRLLAPDWAGDKDRALTALGEYLKRHDLKQGDST